MNVGRKLLLIIVTSVALVTVPSMGVIYYYTKHKTLASEANALVGETRILVAINAPELMEAELSLKSLSRSLGKELSTPAQIGEVATFDNLMQRDADGAWRSQGKKFDGSFEAGIFLPPDAPLDTEQKRLHLRSKRVMDIFAGSINSPFSNVWLLTPGKTEIIYDHGVPDFVTQMAADTDYTKTPWVTLGNPATNPERGLRWTPPLFDPVPKSWMISAVLPVDVNGRWIGNVGHDIYLKNVFAGMFQSNQRYAGEQHFLLDVEGNYIYAGPWQKALEANPEKFKPDFRNEPDLAILLAHKELNSQVHLYEREVSLQGRKYLAIDAPMPPIGWRYARLVPVDEILAPMHQFFYALVAMVLAIGLFIGFLIDAAVKRNVVNRLQILANTVRRYGLGELDARAGLAGNDEIAKTSHEFDAMAEQMKSTLDAIPDLLFEIGLDGRYYAAHSPYNDLLAVPPKELIGRTVQKVLSPDAAVVVMSALQEAHEKGYSQGKQYELQVPQGKLWFELSVARKSSNDENPRFIVLARDITERKQAEAAIAESRNLLMTIIDIAPVQVFWKDLNSRYIGCNTAFANDAGFASPVGVIGKDDTQFEWASQAEHYRADDRAVMESGIPKLSYEQSFVAPSGQRLWVRTSKVPLKNQNNKTIGLLGVDEDITERKQIEQALIESEYRWKFAIEGSGYGVWDVNVQTNEAKYSKRWKELLGYAEDEIMDNRQEWISRIHPDDQAHVVETGQAYLEGRTETYVVEYRIRCKDESYKWMLSRGVVVSRSEDGKPLRMIGTQADITERKLAEDKLLQTQVALQESHNRYVDLYEFAPIGYLSISKHGMITELNWRATAMLGLERRHILQHRFVQFVADDDKDRWKRQFSEMNAFNGGEELSFDLQLVHNDGSIFHANLNCVRMDDVGEQPMLRVTLEDVTQVKQAADALRQREGYQRALLDNFPFLVWLKDKKGRFLTVNQPFAKACGQVSANQLTGKTDLDIWPRELAETYQADDRVVLNSGRSKNIEELIEINGKQVWFETYKSPVAIDGEVVGTVGFARDITESKKAEKYEQFRSHILELLVGDEPLSKVLEAIVLGVEQLYPKMLCSILLLDNEGKHLGQGVTPSLPAFYNAAIDGIEIGMGVGSCGTAAFTGERVIVDDMATHPYWASYQELVASAGLGACWSQPIRASSGQVIGAFDIYHREAHTPAESDIALIEQSARLASIAIERKQAEMKLREGEERFRSMIEAIPDAIFLKDGQSRWLVVNETAKRLFKLHDIPWYGKTEMELAELHPEFRAAHEACLTDDEKTWEAGELMLFDEAAVGEDGQGHDFEVRKVPIYGEQGQRKALVIIGRDITERKLAEDDLRIAATAFETHEGLFVTDAKSIILRVNHAFTDITGYTAKEAIGQTPRLLSSGRHDTVFYAAMWESINNTGVWEGEVWNQRKNGEVYPEHLTITAVKGPGGIVTNYVAALVDITMEKAAAKEIQHLAFYDPLTQLPNRRLLLDRLNHALAASARSGRQGAVLFLDLDHFKTLNDTLGHDIGDMLLQQAAERLTASVREGDSVARLGGDEFVVVLEDLSEQDLEAATQAETIANKILAALNQPYQLATHEQHSTVSIGVTLFSNHQSALEELLKQADIAMYQAKKAGRNTLRFFNPQMQTSITARVGLERELYKALDNQQFQLYYQIQVDHLGHPLGAEALIRWLHPERGLVPPFEFIPLAEETGLILPIGQWVLDTACLQLKAWQQDALTRDLTLSINVSAKQFRQIDFVDQVQAAVLRHSIDPMQLKLELTESLLLENVEDTVAAMTALGEIGVQFSLDDFGTGYSSLQYLKRLPLNQLKIDQSFVRDIVVDSSDRSIVRTIIAMAQSLYLNVIAEGVETAEQRELLLINGCKRYQGYLFSKPVPIEQFEALLKP